MGKAHWEDKQQMIAGLSSLGRWGHICLYIGAIMAVLGIIGDVTDSTIGLAPSAWFLLAIGALLVSITFFIGWAVSWYLSTK